MTTVWDYAIKRKNPVTKELEGQCSRCNKIIKCSGNSTTTLKNHLKTHKINLDAPKDQPRSEELFKKRQKTITDFFERKNLKEIVSDMAIDGISIRAITRNSYIRQSLLRDGLKLPANESDVMKLIHDDFEEKRQLMIKELKIKISTGVKFSMSVDEVTTVRGRRYFGLNLHERLENITYKTGLIRILGKCTAIDMIEVIQKHLELFGITIKKDLVGSTQDGAAVNKKFIRHLDIVGQFCLNHGTHLGVCDTLYKNFTAVDESNNDLNDDHGDEDLYDVGFDINFDEGSGDDVDYLDLLENSRKIVKFVKHSSVRNQIFQSKIQTLYGREKELHLDVKTRWNSIPTMLESIIKAEYALRETCEELNAQDLIQSINFRALTELLEAMEPIKLAVENLSKEDATLLTADTIIKFMFDKLSSFKSDISKKLCQNLRIRIDERLNDNLMELLRSLKDPSHVPTCATITFAGQLASRLFDSENSVFKNEQTASPAETETKSLQDELKALLQKNNVPASSSRQDNLKWLKGEFTLFKNTGTRTENLQKLFDAILTIKPTSTDVERVFSVCASFCTKIRSRLSDKSLGALVFLKYYYMNSK